MSSLQNVIRYISKFHTLYMAVVHHKRQINARCGRIEQIIMNQFDIDLLSAPDRTGIYQGLSGSTLCVLA